MPEEVASPEFSSYRGPELEVLDMASLELRLYLRCANF